MEYASPELQSQFIDDHVVVALRRNPRSLGETAIRLGSRDMREVLAGRAVSPPVGFDQLIELLDAGELGWGERARYTVNTKFLAEVARVLASQRFTPDDLDAALRIYDFIHEHDEPSVDGRHRAIRLHLKSELLSPGQRSVRFDDPAGRVNSAVLTMLECNRRHSPGRPRRAWLRSLNRLLGTRCTLAGREGTRLSRLETRGGRNPAGAEKVSIIVPVGSEAPTAGLRSVLRQHHSPLELVIVTGRGLDRQSRDLVAAVGDARVVETDRAVYGALVNRGIEAATGSHIMVLSPDDWCVPHLTGTLLHRLSQSGEAVAARAARFRADSELRLGPFGASRPEIFSKILMFERAVVDRIGYFDEVGPDALEEYVGRIRATFGKRSVNMSRTKVLALTPDEREFIPAIESAEGQECPSFPIYRSAFARWHQRCVETGETPYLASGAAERPFSLPLAMREAQGRNARARYDIVFASDWRPFGGPAKSMLEEITAARRSGLRIGVMNLEAVRMMAPITRNVCRPVQDLVDSGVVDMIDPSDDVDIDTLIIRYPLVLQFDRELTVNCRVGKLLIHANQPPCEADGSDLRYFVDHCEANAERWFGVAPSWMPQGPQARQALLDAPTPPRRLEPFDLPGILDPAEWEMIRDDFRSDLPVLGRHSRDHATKWPGDSETLLRVYPADPAYDFRNMGGASTPLEVLGGRLPTNWIAYGYDETDVKDFLFQLDFWVYFPNEIRIEAFGRAILEAMASGCVVILPDVFKSTFGDGALYCTPGEVRTVIDKYRADLGAFLEQSRRGQQHVREHFSYEWYQQLLQERLLPRSAA